MSGCFDDLAERHVGQDQLGGDALAFGIGGDPGEPVARLLLVGLGEHLAQVGKDKALTANGAGVGHG